MRNNVHKLSAIAFYCLTCFISIGAQAASSPFAAVPIYLTKIEESKAKSNLFLVIDDSGSMGYTNMEIAKNVAKNLVTDEDNLSKFRFGVAHLYDPPRYNPIPWFQPQGIIMAKIDDAES